ncbi:MAG: hypothetical protein LC722_00040 [Actinobacteria bacterium]|nr:hypothetical protein [Actinomycetota bacterium]
MGARGDRLAFAPARRPDHASGAGRGGGCADHPHSPRGPGRGGAPNGVRGAHRTGRGLGRTPGRSGSRAPAVDGPPRGGPGEPPGIGVRHTRALYLVCTHGRRDPCCAERGRPLARSLSAARPDGTWEASHIGGDRFAGNLVCFPHGLYFGRVAPGAAEAIAAAYERGTVPTEHYRGRSCYGFAVQVAEAHLRREHGIDGVDDLRLRSASRARRWVTAAFSDAGGAEHTVRVVVGRGEPRRLTCHSDVPARPRGFAPAPA